MGVFSCEKMKKINYYYIPTVLQKIGYVLFFLSHHFFVHLEIKGKENFKNINGPIILAPNHTSELDVTIIPLLFPFFSKFFPIYFTTNSKEKYRKSLRFGWRSFFYGGVIFDLLGGSQIYSGYKNYSISLKNHTHHLKRGNTVCIFPEGSISLDGKLSRGHGGVGYLVHTTKAPVFPIAINTFYEMSWKKYFSRKDKVTITICPPMYKKDLIFTTAPKVEDFQLASRMVLEKISEVLKLKSKIS